MNRTYLPVHPNENAGKVTIQINFTNERVRHNLTIEIACAKNMGEVPSHSRRLEKYIELNFPEIDSTGRVNTGISIRNNIMSRVRDELDKMIHIKDLETTHVSLSIPSTSSRTEYDKPWSTGNQELSSVKANLDMLRNQNTALRMQLQTLNEDKPWSTGNQELSSVKANLDVLRNQNTALRMQLQTLNKNSEYIHNIYGTRISSLENQIRMGMAESYLELRNNSQLLNTKGVLENVFKQLYDVQKAMCAAAKTKFDSVDAFILSRRDELECLGLKNELDRANNVLVTLRRDADDHEREINLRYQHVKRLINMNLFEELVHTSLVTSIVNDPPDILMDVVCELLEVTDGARFHENNESSFELHLNIKLLLEKVYKEIFDIQKHMCEEAKTKFDSVDAVILTARDEVECMDLVEELDEAANIVDALRRDTIDLETEIELKYDHVQAMIEINAFSEILEISLVNSVISYPPDIILDLIPRLVLMCGNNEPFTGEELGPVGITNTTQYQNANQNANQNTTRNQQPQETCPICMENFSNNTVFLECTHRYHRPCIQEWLDDNNNCPVCRQIVGNVDI